MTPLRSRHTVALGTLLLGMLLVVSPVLEAFAGTCPRQGPEAADEIGMVERGSGVTVVGGPSARLQDDCAGGATAYINVAVSVESPRWAVDVDPHPSWTDDRPPVSRMRGRPSVDAKAPVPSSPETQLRSVVLQV